MSGLINEYAYAFYQSYSMGRRLGRNAERVARNNSPVALECTNLRVGQGYELNELRSGREKPFSVAPICFLGLGSYPARFLEQSQGFFDHFGFSVTLEDQVVDLAACQPSRRMAQGVEDFFRSRIAQALPKQITSLISVLPLLAAFILLRRADSRRNRVTDTVPDFNRRRQSSLVSL